MFSWRRSGTLPFRPIKSRLASWPPTTVTPGARPTTTLSRVSPQKKLIVEFIKMTVQKFTYTWFLILCCYLNDPQLCFFVQWQLFMSLMTVVHFPEQLNCRLFFRKILQLTQILWFSSIFVCLNPFKQWLYDFEIHLFTLRTTERLIYNYYRRFRHSLMLQKKKHVLRETFWIWRSG